MVQACFGLRFFGCTGFTGFRAQGQGRRASCRISGFVGFPILETPKPQSPKNESPRDSGARGRERGVCHGGLGGFRQRLEQGAREPQNSIAQTDFEV